MNQEDILLVAAPVVETLERLGVKYHIGGSVASMIQGVPRSTVDVDMVADLRAEHVEPFVAALTEEYYVEQVAVREALEHRSSFNLIHWDTSFKIDIFVLKPGGFEQAAFERAEPIALETESGTREFVVSTAEDIILQKLHWYRMGGEVSERQWKDSLGVAKVTGEELDIAYMKQWADRIGVADLLERVLLDAGLAAS